MGDVRLKNLKPIYTYPLLILGASIILYSSAIIDVNMRLSIIEGTGVSPNMSPRIMYIFAAMLLCLISVVSCIVEAIREKIFKCKNLLWWQAIIIGGSYAIYFYIFSLRHVFSYDTAHIIIITVSIIINPITTYYIFKGFSKNAA